MKATTFGAAALLALVGFFDSVEALEHPLLASTADFEETWQERPEKDMVTEMKERRQTKYTDSAKRPIIGVLTEPLRGDIYKSTQSRDKVNGEHVPGYVPRSHV